MYDRAPHVALVASRHLFVLILSALGDRVNMGTRRSALSHIFPHYSSARSIMFPFTREHAIQHLSWGNGASRLATGRTASCRSLLECERDHLLARRAARESITTDQLAAKVNMLTKQQLVGPAEAREPALPPSFGLERPNVANLRVMARSR